MAISRVSGPAVRDGRGRGPGRGHDPARSSPGRSPAHAIACCVPLKLIRPQLEGEGKNIYVYIFVLVLFLSLVTFARQPCAKQLNLCHPPGKICVQNTFPTLQTNTCVNS